MEDLSQTTTITPLKNDIVTSCPLYCFIRCSNGMIATVDPDDWCRLHNFKWHAKKSRGGWYAYRKITVRNRTRYIYMHRSIINPSKDFHVHHKNGMTLFNAKNNLEILDPLVHAIMTKFRSLQRKKLTT